MTPEARFQTLFDDHYAAVSRYLRSRGHQTADADDLIAGTFEVAWRRLDRVPVGREAVPWLLAVARNLSRNAQRRSRRELTFLRQLADERFRTIEELSTDRGEAERVLRALTELKPLDRELILLVAWHELSPAEAGQVLGLGGNATRTRLHRARRRLSGLLAEPAPSGPANSGAVNFIPPTIELGGPHDA